MTPLTCWNTPCTPQKHPPARTTTAEVACPGGASTAGAGSARAPSAAAAIAPDRQACQHQQRQDKQVRARSRGCVSWLTSQDFVSSDQLQF